jgi:tRNA dimethylallyltransferase
VPPVPPHLSLRQALEERARREGAEALYRTLLEVDPEAARRIDPRNVRRVIRALEVCLEGGKPFSEWRTKKGAAWRWLALGLTYPTRQALYQALERRVEAMVRGGWPEEVRRLLAQGYPPDLPVFTRLGYRPLIEAAQGRVGLEAAIAQVKRLHRRLARRQYAWFRPEDPRIRWLTVGPALEGEAKGLVEGFLAGSSP